MTCPVCVHAVPRVILELPRGKGKEKKHNTSFNATRNNKRQKPCLLSFVRVRITSACRARAPSGPLQVPSRPPHSHIHVTPRGPLSPLHAARHTHTRYYSYSYTVKRVTRNPWPRRPSSAWTPRRTASASSESASVRARRGRIYVRQQLSSSPSAHPGGRCMPSSRP